MLTDNQLALIQSAYYAGTFGGKNAPSGVVILSDDLGKALKALPDDEAIAKAKAWKQSVIDANTAKLALVQTRITELQATIAADQAILDGLS